MLDKFMKRWNDWAKAKQRPGQAMFNALHEFDRETAEKIMGSENDPFYNDERIPALLMYLTEIWKDR